MRCGLRNSRRLCIALLAAAVAYIRVYHQSPLSSSSSSSLIPGGEWREEQPTTTHQHNMIPVIGEAKFNEYYGLKYKGQLSSVISKRDSPDNDEDVVSCGTNPDFFDFFKLSQSQRSRYGEDKAIYDIFFKVRTTDPGYNGDESPLPKGTYIELGAFDGKQESNTIFFDNCLGWEGLLIEGQSESYEKVILNRPRAVKLSFSPTCENENETVQFHNYPMTNSGLQGSAKTYDTKNWTVDVPCGPLTSVLQNVFGTINPISFLSLDVEGAESMVLNVLDLNTVTIDVIMIEIMNTHCPNGNCPNTHKVREHMANLGKYDLFSSIVKASDVYARIGTEAWKRAKSIEMK